MSMTREEAIEILENGGWWEALIPVTTMKGRDEEDKLHEAIDLAISALRPVSREQVEKVWRGEWINLPYTEVYKNKCNRCGKGSDLETNFCPYCGAPMTDEALEITMKRLEELRND